MLRTRSRRWLLLFGGSAACVGMSFSSSRAHRAPICWVSAPACSLHLLTPLSPCLLPCPAQVDHFLRFKTEERQLPVVWQQTLLCFVQRYKTEVRAEDKEALRDLVKRQHHCERAL